MAFFSYFLRVLPATLGGLAEKLMMDLWPFEVTLEKCAKEAGLFWG